MTIVRNFSNVAPGASSTGVIDATKGGTGLSSVGTSGYVLTSNGTAWTSAAAGGGGVTSVAAGTGISVSGSTGAVTISSTVTGTVTSVATGNGLSGGTITTSGTLTVACPTAGSVGSYIFAVTINNTATYGSNYSGSIIQGYCQSSDNTYTNQFTPSGTWKWMAATTASSGYIFGIACRVA